MLQHGWMPTPTLIRPVAERAEVSSDQALCLPCHTLRILRAAARVSIRARLLQHCRYCSAAHVTCIMRIMRAAASMGQRQRRDTYDTYDKLPLSTTRTHAAVPYSLRWVLHHSCRVLHQLPLLWSGIGGSNKAPAMQRNIWYIWVPNYRTSSAMRAVRYTCQVKHTSPHRLLSWQAGVQEPSSCPGPTPATCPAAACRPFQLPGTFIPCGAQSHELCLLLLESKTARSTPSPGPSTVQDRCGFCHYVARRNTLCANHPRCWAACSTAVHPSAHLPPTHLRVSQRVN